MSDLHRHLCLTDSLPASTAKLQRYYSEAAVEDFITIVLRPIVLLPELDAEVVLRRDVIVTLATDLSHAVSWTPSDDGPFPRLTGALQLVADTGESSRLVLIGDTTAQHTTMGHRFNQAIAKELLVYLAHHIS